MPQLVKGGKNTFGWSKVSEAGKIAIPPEAFNEYNFSGEKYAYLFSGSKKSGGFSLLTLDSLKATQFSDVLIDHPELLNPESIFGKNIKYRSRVICVVLFENLSISVPLNILELFGIKHGTMLLTVRGSYVALGFIVKGPIITEAHRHPWLEVYE
jgi:hypothetical protein